MTKQEAIMSGMVLGHYCWLDNLYSKFIQGTVIFLYGRHAFKEQLYFCMVDMI